jgi:hypothetical protein
MAGTDSIAVISDVHGNRWALETVLEDIGGRGIRRLVNLGESVYGPLDPAGTAALLLLLKASTVRGNEDRITVNPNVENSTSPTLAYVRSQLSADHLQWLAGMTGYSGSGQAESTVSRRTCPPMGLRGRCAPRSGLRGQFFFLMSAPREFTIFVR